MTSQLGRVYALLAGIVAFFLAWAAVAAHPWAPQPTRDPRVAALAARQQRVQLESLRVKRIVDLRWAVYRQKLAARNAAAAAQPASAAAPSVRVVNLPPLVVTRTS
jgi:hypothetical protein